ncbi:hypothetical protein llap_17684 [Limosa lapponica baueri]|uniref:Uncharacterized protein n=1 Tax=Limosa lapponica baueri TaxID=1758121 RepID=A0A2I0TE02_LIMLA|nr:hypothetical protein llap_17684 [Limosa lapponica baueri]
MYCCYSHSATHTSTSHSTTCTVTSHSATRTGMSYSSCSNEYHHYSNSISWYKLPCDQEAKNEVRLFFCPKDQLKSDCTGENSSNKDPGEGPSKAHKGKGPSKAHKGKGPSEVDLGKGPSQAVSTDRDDSDTEVIVKSFSMKDLRNLSV